MATQLKMTPNKTYATEANAVKAVQDKFPGDTLRYVMLTADDGRFYPLFLGERAIQAGVHFHFCVAN
jgi:hypothetical protein